MELTQEQKTIILKDLCGRLPFDTLIRVIDNRGSETVEYTTTISCAKVDAFQRDEKIVLPYLRPMSSMTEEEEKEFNDQMYKAKQYSDDKSYNVYEVTGLNIDWLNAHHFDYRGLIPMGLALEYGSF